MATLKADVTSGGGKVVKRPSRECYNSINVRWRNAMSKLTLEALAARLETVEKKLATLTAVVPPSRDWRSVVGISEQTEFSRLMQAEMNALREADRQAALADNPHSR
jgi:hypothetical protein